MDNNSDVQSYWSVYGFGNRTDGLAVRIRIRNVSLTIKVDAKNMHRSPKALEKLRTYEAKFHSNDRDDEADLYEYGEEVALPFLPELRKLAPSVDLSGKITLADLAMSATYRASLEFHDEQPLPGALVLQDSPNADDDEYNVEESKPVLAASALPRFRPSEVEVMKRDLFGIFDNAVENVRVHRQKFFHEEAWCSSTAVTEIEKCRKIDASDLADSKSISKLYGVVVDGSPALVGLLYHWIEGKRISWQLLEKATPDARAKWASQVRHTVSSLHSIGVVWGDVQAANVIVDANGDAVVTRFRGGITHGWIDLELMNTKEGDLQGLGRLVDFILNENNPLRLRYKTLELYGRPEGEEGEWKYPVD